MQASDIKLFVGTFLLSFSLLVGSFAALRVVSADVENSVHIDQLVLSRCGRQYVYASGSATYAPYASHLLVDIDGVHAFNLGKQAFWTTGLVEVDPGQHVVTARIHNTNGTFTDTTSTVIVPACPVDKAEASHGDGDTGPDCCPGPDPVKPTETPIKKPQVKAATIARNVTLKTLQPLNNIFRLAVGRAPLYDEWKYWADRYLGDKPSWEAVFGAIQWHNAQGRTVGL